MDWKGSLAQLREVFQQASLAYPTLSVAVASSRDFDGYLREELAKRGHPAPISQGNQRAWTIGNAIESHKIRYGEWLNQVIYYGPAEITAVKYFQSLAERAVKVLEREALPSLTACLPKAEMNDHSRWCVGLHSLGVSDVLPNLEPRHLLTVTPGSKVSAFVKSATDKRVFRQCLQAGLLRFGDQPLLIAETQGLEITPEDGFAFLSLPRLDAFLSSALAIDAVLQVSADAPPGIAAKQLAGQRIGMPRFPRPEGVRWSRISLILLTGHTVRIEAGDVTKCYTYSDMGMKSERNAEPTKQWALLCSFARGDGYMNRNHADFTLRNQKQKELLANRLQEFFGLPDDPFENLPRQGWKTRFQIKER